MSSAPISSGGQVGSAAATASCHQTSRASSQATSLAVRRTTSTFCTDGHSATASSTASLSGTTLPRRQAPSAVMTTLHSASWMRPASEEAEKPPKTTECGAPMRAQASMRDRQLRHHAEVDRDAVALADAEGLERARGALDLGQQLGVGEGALVARLADPLVGELVAAARLHVPVEAVVGDVQRAVGEPLVERRVRRRRASASARGTRRSPGAPGGPRRRRGRAPPPRAGSCRATRAASANAAGGGNRRPSARCASIAPRSV